MKKVTIIHFFLIVFIVIGLIISVIIMANGEFVNALLFFIAYESLLYPVFIGLIDNYGARKIRRIIYVGSSDNPELIECKINKKLAELSRDNFTIVDIRIIQNNGRRRNAKEAYILYY